MYLFKLQLHVLSQFLHDPSIGNDGVKHDTVLRDSIPDVAIIDCDLFSGGSVGVVALLLEDSRLYQISVVSVAYIDSKDCYKGIVEWISIEWMRKPFCMCVLSTQITNLHPSSELPNPCPVQSKIGTYLGVEQ